MNEKIMVVDDEADIVMMLKDYFEMKGYEVLTAMDAREGIRLCELQPDLILLDINMPETDGFEMCRRIREFVSCPILFLTARIEDSDKIKGFGVGGDDYIVKPFSIRELGARVAAHLRREQRCRQSNSRRFDDNLTIDYTARCVYCGNEPLPLAKKEFDIVELLSLHMGQVFSREQIYAQLWPRESTGDCAIVTEHIRRIRTKLADFQARPHIETVWGVGYKWID